LKKNYANEEEKNVSKRDTMQKKQKKKRWSGYLSTLTFFIFFKTVLMDSRITMILLRVKDIVEDADFILYHFDQCRI
jgi:hypothetical protein